MALSDLVPMALVREAVESVTGSLEDPTLLKQIWQDEIVPSRKQLQELIKISTSGAVPLHKLIEELKKASASLAQQVPWDVLIGIAGDEEAADEWRKGDEWPDTNHAHNKLIAAARAGHIGTDSATQPTQVLNDRYADLAKRIENTITALAEARYRADQTIKLIAQGTQAYAPQQSNDEAATDAITHEPHVIQSATGGEKHAEEPLYKTIDALYETERLVRANQDTNTRPSTRTALCVECGLTWKRPSSRNLQHAFLCELCSEGTPLRSNKYGYLDLWD